MTPFVPSRRRLLQSLGAGLAFAATSARAAFPDRPSKIIVPWAAGGSTDAIARALAQKLSESFKQPFVVDNRPGNGGHIGADLAAKSPPDGYTSIVLELSHVYAPAVVAKLPYDVLRDFTPVTLIGTSPMILFGPPDAGDYRAYLKKLAASPVPPAMANTGTGSVSHLVGELFSQATGIKFNMVPYRGGAPAMTDLAAGQVSAYFATLATAFTAATFTVPRSLLTTRVASASPSTSSAMMSSGLPLAEMVCSNGSSSCNRVIFFSWMST